MVGALSSTRGATRTFSAPSAPALQVGERIYGVQETLLFSGIHDAVGELGELADVLLAAERPGAQRMSVGDGELVG